MAEDLRKLYDGVSSQLDVGDYNTFVQKMQTPQDRKRFYDAVTSNGFDLGDYNSYEQRLSSVKKKKILHHYKKVQDKVVHLLLPYLLQKVA